MKIAYKCRYCGACFDNRGEQAPDQCTCGSDDWVGLSKAAYIKALEKQLEELRDCLLYTSDAADE